MKKNATLIGFLICVSFSVTAQNNFRVMSLNIDRAQENTLDSIGRFIMKFAPDAVALQELDMYPNRPGQDKNYIAELSNFTRMYGIFGLTWKHYLGWDCGNAVLSKEPFEKTENFILPQQGKETRGLIITYFNFKGYRICLASTHLNYENFEIREAQIKYIDRIMKKQEADIVVLCGDFNTKNTSEVLNVMTDWHDALPVNENTFSTKPNFYQKMKVDYILYKSILPIEITNASVICDASITDHCACLVDIKIPNIIMHR